MQPPSTLFVSHAATRSGAPLMFLHLLRWLQREAPGPRQILSLRKGALWDEFAAAAEPATPALQRIASATHELAVARAALERVPPRLQSVRRLRPILAGGERVLRRVPTVDRSQNFDLIYANSAVCATVLPLLSRFRCPIITHIHELEYALSMSAPSLPDLWRYTTHFVAASNAVKHNLVNTHGISPEKVTVIYECIDAYRETENHNEGGERLRRELGLPPDAFLVGGSGTFEWRKGTDWFSRLAYEYSDAGGRPVYFVWIGGNRRDAYFASLEFDLRRWNLDHRLKFVDEVADPLPLYAALDAFALTSREDPFPLVCLEAASAGVPVVCFADAGGMPEFVEDDAGLVVPYGDLRAIAAAISKLAAAPQLRSQLGRRAQQKVRQRCDVKVVSPQVLEVMRRVAGKHSV